MEKASLRNIDRILIIFLVISVIGNIVLAVFLGKSRSSQGTTTTDVSSISSAAMAELLAEHPPVFGRSDAPITLVLFSDFQCPYCRQFHGTLKQLDPKQKNDLRIVFRHFPLPMHKFAHKDAELAVCAELQSNEAFWALYDYFYGDFNSEEDPTNAVLRLLKNRQDVDLVQYETCVRNHLGDATIDRDIALGKKYAVHGTPTMFVNGRRLTGVQRSLSAILHSISNQP